MSLIDKYLGESKTMKLLPARNTKKLKDVLKKNKIKFSETPEGIMVGIDDFDRAEELMTKNLLF